MNSCRRLVSVDVVAHPTCAAGVSVEDSGFTAALMRPRHRTDGPSRTRGTNCSSAIAAAVPDDIQLAEPAAKPGLAPRAAYLVLADADPDTASPLRLARHCSFADADITDTV
jgi:hypothetical protein